MQAEGPCPRYPDAEYHGLTGDAAEVERLRRQLAGAVALLREAQGELEYAIANGSDLAHDDVRRVDSILRAALGGQ